ncbi:LOW QUALITY PROTEIN: peptide methionine sulfoxide reductase MsrA 2-like [Haliotis rubra]|uniref:LOW QUALITY PROTEIN: peptide methionine sulfoxide reductase MsrA 2-like n=1 Tax=Haliotis rubra TaxID=36100 RepID=UPI001EE59CD4|nr:LOW QUALITY PROTEIN: peptide methionine sulfoxide reductase MsrA 2-like [Haliotis rubra]
MAAGTNIMWLIQRTARLLLAVSLVKNSAPSISWFAMGDLASKMSMITKEEALPGRNEGLKVSPKHAVNGNPTVPPFPENMKMAMIGMGCFWGVERKYWKEKGVYSTHVGYAAGYTKNPTYREVCTGQTGHSEVVRVVYDPEKTNFTRLLQVFWENHNPTQGMQQGNDSGTQYRSGIYYYDDEQKQLAETSRDAYQELLTKKGYPQITTEILPVPEFYYAEDYHQQYLYKNPGGYCGLGGVGVSCPVGVFGKNKKKDEL